jgi:glycosyltransferase involved in cell wall biosynthesis
VKIAFLSTFYPFRGGIAQFNAALYRELEKNHEVKAFTFKRQYPDLLFPGSSQYITKEDKADPVPAEEILDTINPFSYFLAAKKIKAFAPDLLIMKYWMPFFAPSLGTVSSSLKKNCKIISILDNVIPHEKRMGDIGLTKFFLRQNNGFVVMSDAVKKDLLSLKPEAKYLFHEHPLYDHFGERIDKVKAREQLKIARDKKVILFFGFIRDYKGLDLLIQAMKNTPDDYLLIIAGEVYGSFDKYKKQIDENALGDKVQLHVRYISDNEVPVFFSAADVCVLPYKSATQSGITSISYHFDLPIIATDVGGLKESVLDNKTGIVVKSPDPAFIQGALRAYFDGNLKEPFADSIRTVKKGLSWSHLAQQLLEFYKTL